MLIKHKIRYIKLFGADAQRTMTFYESKTNKNREKQQFVTNKTQSG